MVKVFRNVSVWLFFVIGSSVLFWCCELCVLLKWKLYVV